MKTKIVFKVPIKILPKADKTRELILATSQELFFEFGFSRVTTDKIASSLGISKATLYKHFLSKEQILREIVERMMKLMGGRVEIILHDAQKDFLEKVEALLTFMGMQIARMGNLITQDIQKNASEIWKDIEDFRKQKVMAHLKYMLGEGTKAGIFCKDIDQDLFVLIYTTVIQQVLNPSTLIQFNLSFSEVFTMIMRILFEGILTPKARRRFAARSRHLHDLIIKEKKL